jgi:hypothetical protein
MPSRHCRVQGGFSEGERPEPRWEREARPCTLSERLPDRVRGGRKIVSQDDCGSMLGTVRSVEYTSN